MKGAAMDVTVLAPSARLAPFVTKLVIIETPAEVTRAPLPEPGLALGIRYAGAASLIEGERSVRFPDTTLTGLLGAVRRIRTHAGSAMILAHFHTACAAAFFRAPVDELTGLTRPLDDLLPRADVSLLAERIAEQPSNRRRAAVLEAFLLERLRPDALDPIAGRAVAALDGARGTLRIADLARQLGISQDPLEKRVRRAVGTSPKHLASMFRLRHAIAIGQRGESWTRAAHAAGYFDQSHFIREFRAFAGDTPSRFFRAGVHCTTDDAPLMASRA
jgi:AraC-like DNA-binding protein